MGDFYAHACVFNCNGDFFEKQIHISTALSISSFLLAIADSSPLKITSSSGLKSIILTEFGLSDSESRRRTLNRSNSIFSSFFKFSVIIIVVVVVVIVVVPISVVVVLTAAIERVSLFS